MLHVGSTVAEAVRLVVVQKLLQSRGLKLNPITTLYYVRERHPERVPPSPATASEPS